MGVSTSSISTPARTSIPRWDSCDRPDGFRQTHGKFEFSPRPKNMPAIRKFRVFPRRRLFRRPLGAGRDESGSAGRVQSGLSPAAILRRSTRRVASTGSNDRSSSPRTSSFQRAATTSHRFAAATRSVPSEGQWTATARSGGFYDGTLRELSWRGRFEFSRSSMPSRRYRGITLTCRRAVEHEPGEQPSDLHPVTEDVPVRAGAVSVPHRIRLDERPFSLGVPTRQRIVPRLQRWADNADQGDSGSAEPQLRREGHAAVSVSNRSRPTAWRSALATVNARTSPAPALS